MIPIDYANLVIRVEAIEKALGIDPPDLEQNCEQCGQAVCMCYQSKPEQDDDLYDPIGEAITPEPKEYTPIR